MLLKYSNEGFLELQENAETRDVLSLEPDVNVVDLSQANLPSVIELSFPTYKDGRAFSQARALRELGYEGVLRATGDVLRDQLLYMVRCGFNEFQFEKAYMLSELEEALSEFQAHYQASILNFNAIWQARSARTAMTRSAT